jgi:hypothetical protein
MPTVNPPICASPVPTLGRALALWILLLIAQQGAFVHELVHLASADHARQADARAVAEAICGQCPAFSQVVTPAVGHSLCLPPLVQVVAERGREPRFEPLTADLPSPRNRGPPPTA